MQERKKPGEGLLPFINPKFASMFEDAFVVLVEFGENEFRNYVANRPVEEQQIIFDVFSLFGSVLLQKMTVEDGVEQ